jgi:hypothetical protein
MMIKQTMGGSSPRLTIQALIGRATLNTKLGGGTS